MSGREPLLKFISGLRKVEWGLERLGPWYHLLLGPFRAPDKGVLGQLGLSTTGQESSFSSLLEHGLAPVEFFSLCWRSLKEKQHTPTFRTFSTSPLRVTGALSTWTAFRGSQVTVLLWYKNGNQLSSLQYLGPCHLEHYYIDLAPVRKAKTTIG